MTEELLNRHRFFLIQRLMRRQGQAPGKGFDRLFSLDYMGSAEFEWGAIPDSLKRMRAAGGIVAYTENITRLDITKPVHFVASHKGLHKKVADFQDWFAQPELDSLEWTGLHELFTGDTGSRRTPIRVEAWWSLQDDIAWALDMDVAMLLVEAFTPSS